MILKIESGRVVPLRPLLQHLAEALNRDLVVALWREPERVLIEQARRRVGANILELPIDMQSESTPIVFGSDYAASKIIVGPGCAANNLRVVPVTTTLLFSGRWRLKPTIDHRQLVQGENAYDIKPDWVRQSGGSL